MLRFKTFGLGLSIGNIIEKEKIYPITVLTRLTKKEKQELLDYKIVVCSQILKKPEVLENLRLSKKKLRLLFQELEDICS